MSHENYESWLNNLEVLAAINHLHLHIDTYSYHHYFSREYEPQQVIDDIKILSHNQKDNRVAEGHPS